MTQEELVKELKRRAKEVQEQIKRLEEAKRVDPKLLLMIIGPMPKR